MSKRINLILPDGLYDHLKALTDAAPRAVSIREDVTLASVAREALLRGAESLERDIKREGKP